MDYSNYSIKEKALIAAIIMAIVENVQKFHGAGLGDDYMSRLIKAKMQQDFDENFLSVAKAEIAILYLPSAALETATLSPAVWKGIANQGVIINRMKKIFIDDMGKNEKAKFYASSSQLALFNVFNVRLK